MSLNPFKEKGIAPGKQYRTGKQIVSLPYKKQEVDADTRCRVILMNGIERIERVFAVCRGRCERVKSYLGESTL